MSNRTPTTVIRVPLLLHKDIKEDAKRAGFSSMVAFLNYLVKNNKTIIINK